MKKDHNALSPDAVTEIAQQLNVREKDVMEMETRMGGHEMSLEPMTDDGEDDYAPISYLVAPNSDPTDIIAGHQHDRLQTEGIEEALSTLDDRSRRIVESRWLRDEDDGGTRTLQDLANEYGVSAERIRQIEAKALKKMKEALVEYA